MESWLNDLKHALRLFAKAPAFTAAAIVSLAIGIGVNTATFSVANALLLRPLPYPDADRIAILWQRSPGLNVAQDWMSLGQYLDIAAENTVFDGTAAAIGASFNLTGGARPERLDGVRVSASFFPLFGARPLLGRVLTSDDNVPGKTQVVVLTHGFWQRRFAGDRSVVGKTLALNGNPLTVVGVLRPDFTFSREVMPAVNGIQRTEVVLPIPLPQSARAKRDGEDFNVFAKLKRDVSLEQAQAQMDGIAARMKRDYPASYPPNGGLTISVVRLIDQVVGDVRLVLYVLLVAVGLVLLIACGNVANLQLSRAAVREKEIAIRAALGAARSRLIRQLLTENLLLAAVSGVIGLGLAALGVAAMRLFGPANIPRMAEVEIDGRVLAFTALVSLSTAALFGLVPALRAAGIQVHTVLTEAGRGLSASNALGFGHGRLRKALITIEVALCVVLLTGAGLLVRSFVRVSAANPGFDEHDVLSFRLSLPGVRYKSPEMVAGFYDQLSRRLRALPGVEHVGMNYQLPLSSVALAWEPIGVEGYVPKGSGENLIIASSAYISADYLNAMRIPLIRGRMFTEQDNKQAPEVVIVNQALAARFWPGTDALGKRLRQGSDGPWRTVVGVVADTKEYTAMAEPPIAVYFAVEQYTIGSRFVVVRTAPSFDAAALTTEVTRILRDLDPELPAYDVATMEARLHDSLARRRLSTFLLAVFAAFATLLASIGTYALIAYWADQRRREIGIRMALGADRARILTLVAREFAVMIAIGLVIGLAVSFAVTRVMTALLFAVSATDLVTFVSVPVLVALVGLVASYVPASRASRTDPALALRFE
jgi:predicted permease